MEFVKSVPEDDQIVVEGYFAASPAKVFEAWTDPNIVLKWFGRASNSLHSATIDLRPGGAWQFLKSKDDDKSIGFEGQYQDIQPGEKLVFSWAHVITHANGEREATPYSRVEVIFTPKGKGTHVRLVHSAIRSQDARRGIGGGWEAAFNFLVNALDKSESGLK
ncbi:MAG: SRPBCC domain-containing protein [Alphaproteobacteria bacterium]|nr:SRPBCC domain-containing protein [Alphaproteobacteria bacterium]